MPYLNLKPGDKVVVTINDTVRDVDTHNIYLAIQPHAVFTETDTVTIAVDPTPEHWPPQLGDIWHAKYPPDGETDIYVAVVNPYGGVNLIEVRGMRGALLPEEALSGSPTWVLAYREKAVS